MDKHTKEPWALYRNGQSVGDAIGHAVCDVWPRGDDQIASKEGKANARRIVACVNSCRGLPTDELEQKGLVAAVGTQLLDVERQRDELLAALDEISKLPSYRQDECSEMARDAIAKANGGAS